MLQLIEYVKVMEMKKISMRAAVLTVQQLRENRICAIRTGFSIILILINRKWKTHSKEEIHFNLSGRIKRLISA